MQNLPWCPGGGCGQIPVPTAVRTGPEAGRPGEGQGMGGEPPRPADKDCLQQTAWQGPQLGTSVQGSGPGSQASETAHAEHTQGSEEGKPSCGFPSQPGLHQGGDGLACGGHLPVRAGTPSWAWSSRISATKCPGGMGEPCRERVQAPCGPVLVSFASTDVTIFWSPMWPQQGPLWVPVATSNGQPVQM